MAVLQSLGRFCHLSTCQEQLLSNTSCSNVTSYNDIDLALCVEDSLVLYLVCAVFWILSIARLLIVTSSQPPIPFNRFNAAKLAVLAIPLITAVSDLFYTVHQRSSIDVASVLYVTPIFLIISFALVAVILYHERRIGIRSSGLLFLYWMSLVLYGAFKLLLASIAAHDSHGVRDAFRFTTFCLQFVSYLVEFVLVLIPEPRVILPTDQDKERDPCPEKGATFPSQITWWWFNGLIQKGWKKALEMSDLTDLNEEDKAKVITASFNKYWNQELQKANIAPEEVELSPADTPDLPGSTNNLFLDDDSDTVPLDGGKGPGQKGYRVIAGKPVKPKKPSLVWAIIKTSRNNLIESVILKVANDLLAFVSPLLLGAMISYTSDSTEAAWRGYFYALMLFVTAAVQSLCLHQYFHRCFVLGMRLRTALIASVYKKALQISSRARKDTTVGEIVNLMSVDAQRFIELMPYCHMIWSAPLQIVLSIALLWLTMGPSVLAGVGAMVLLLPLNFISGLISKKLQVKLMRMRDERIKMTNEILNGIKVIKFYAWEIPFKALVGDIRIRELGILRKIAYLTSGISLFWTCAPFLVALATFTTYALAYKDDPDNQLTAQRAFVALSLFNILRFPLSMLPMLIPNFIQTYVSVGRLQKFLTSEELHPDRITVADEPATDQEDSISVVGGTFTWDSPERPVLSDLNLHIKPGQLVAVVGQVGAGKSSLISALLGEVEKVEGTVNLRGRVAYVPQQAWIQNASVKDNILFAQPMNEVTYNQAIHACALEPDMDILPAGDATEIGEKGINLSGGQKQRVSLARAVYQQADIYLLDDPLSAVDSHVGKHIFEKVIGPEGMLQGKVRVLVTHGLTFLPQCDLIVVLVDGRISEIGTYSELLNNKGAFSEFIETYAHVEEESKTPEPADTAAADSAAAKKSTKTKDPSSGAIGPKGGAEATPKPNDGGQDKAKKGLVTKEKAETGTVKVSVFATYLKACTYPMSLVVVACCLLVNGMGVGTNVWLSEWSDSTSKPQNATGVHHVGYYLGIYAAFGIGQCLLTLFNSLALAVAALIGAKALHNRMLDSILRAPMAFFDTTPLGRILNRFSKDIQTIDEIIPQTLASFLNTLFSVVSTALVIMVATPMFTVVIIPLVIIYFVIQRYYVSTSRQLQRIESISRSPIYSHFQESIQGATSIRAYRLQGRFVSQNEQKVDHSQLAYYPTICSNRWLAIRLEFLGNLVILFSAFFAAIQRNYGKEMHLEITPGLVGLSITYALQITQSLNWFVRMTSQLESNIVAVERTNEYSDGRTIGAEAPAIIASHRPPDGWPTAGEVRFERYSTRYREGMDLVLKDISVMMNGNKKIGIVGRTGAGKTSMTLALFRIIEAVEGFIQIDGINIADIGLQDLRSRITIIPQDPVLFSGTLRLNLDPFNAYSDEDLWRVLEIAHLKDFVSTLAEGLAYPVSEGGENLSVGQRQLVCLARALLRKTKILVLDEATAAVDMETDDLIQKTIRSEFASCTVFTIAHRLNTILDYDYVLVLGAGQVLEYASPTELLANSNSVFYSMAKDAGLVSSNDAELISSEDAPTDEGVASSKDVVVALS